MEPFFDKIIRGEICPYCRCGTRLAPGDEVYPHRTRESPRPKFLDRMYYICLENPDHYVGTYADNLTALGRLADRELRTWKSMGHSAFDPLWRDKTRFQSQRQAYRWLSQAMNLPSEYTHFGMFTVEQCRQAVRLFQELLQGWFLVFFKKIIARFLLFRFQSLTFANRFLILTQEKACTLS